MKTHLSKERCVVLRAAWPLPAASDQVLGRCLWLRMCPWHMGRKQVRGGLGAARGSDATEGGSALLPAPALGRLCSGPLPVWTHSEPLGGHHFPSCPGLALLLKPGSASPLSSLDSPSGSTACLPSQTWDACSPALGPPIIWLFRSCRTNQTVRCASPPDPPPSPAQRLLLTLVRAPGRAG